MTSAKSCDKLNFRKKNYTKFPHYLAHIKTGEKSEYKI
nr:MAG TPA: hypothetical protein [Caudoviricetes sp.]